MLLLRRDAVDMTKSYVPDLRYPDGLTVGAVVAVQGAGYRVLRAGPKELVCWDAGSTGAELPALLL